VAKPLADCPANLRLPTFRIDLPANTGWEARDFRRGRMSHRTL